MRTHPFCFDVLRGGMFCEHLSTFTMVALKKDETRRILECHATLPFVWPRRTSRARCTLPQAESRKNRTGTSRLSPPSSARSETASATALQAVLHHLCSPPSLCPRHCKAVLCTTRANRASSASLEQMRSSLAILSARVHVCAAQRQQRGDGESSEARRPPQKENDGPATGNGRTINEGF